MRRLAIGIIVMVLAVAPAQAGHGRKYIQETVPAVGVASISVDFPVGELHVVSAAGDEVGVDLKVTCDRWFRSCDSPIADVRLVSDLSAGKLRVEIKGFEHHHVGDLEVSGTITVPAGRELQVDMGVGELDIRGIASRLDVDLGVGEVTVRMPAAAVRSVAIDAGVGDTSLRLPSGSVDEERSVVSSGIDWSEGTGEARVSIDVGVGDAAVTLD
jgi:hypothetical protein